MQIQDFLKKHKTNNLFTTVKEHYINLGGQKSLGISLRHFQQISSGDRSPTELFIDRLFRQVGKKDQKELLVSYFRSRIPEHGRGGIVDYLESHLPTITPSTKSIWESNKPQMFLAKEQIDFLLQHPLTIKPYFLLSLKNRISIEEFGLEENLVEQMIQLDLIAKKGMEIVPSKELLRIPSFETAAPKMAEAGTNLILKCLDVFIDKRGSPEQKTLFSLQYVPSDVADIIQSQIDHLRSLIRAHATDIDDSTVSQVPILFSTFFRVLDSAEVCIDKSRQC